MATARRIVHVSAATLLTLGALTRASGAQQANDSAYTARIRELTPTDPHWKFTTELVDHLPASATVPSPLKVLGYVPGTIGRLSRTEDINRYFRAVAAASPRVKLFSLGMSEEGREMIVAAVADSATIARLDDYRQMTAKLADPRGVSETERTRLIGESKPIYWLTGTIHAPETGSPEMLMELLYRVAVEETPYVQEIRKNVITLITPATEVDGRNRIVDLIEEEKQLKLGRGGIPTVYWGKYIAHDNNRDGLMMSIKLTQHMNTGFLYWHPTVLHDLHESVPFLYTSTGTGPYNDEFDPIVVDEWHTLAYQEITELTKRGLPGVWTHGFYDGWAPNYMLGIAQFRNSLGKFYETFTSGGADCQIVKLPPAQTSKEWDRPNPPVNGVKWCIRSNINYQQSGVLVALNYVARNHETFMENFSLKAVRMVERGRRLAPYAFVIPRDQRHLAEAGDLINYFRKIGSEVQVASGTFSVKSMPAVVERGLIGGGAGPGAAAGASTAGASATTPRADSTATAARDSAARQTTIMVKPGDWIVRMDQPYTALVRTVLALQRFRPDDPSPYDDTGWSLDQLRHVTVHTIADSSVLARPMRALTADVTIDGAVTGSGGTLAVRPLGDWRSATLPWRLKGAAVSVADSAFNAGGTSFPAGTYLMANTPAAQAVVRELGLAATALAAMPAAPSVRTRALTVPRIAFVHTWIETQNEGWVRHAMEEMGVPFTYMSTQRLKEPGLLDRFDVVLFPHVSGSMTAVVNGRPMTGPAIPWKRTPLTPNLGVIDSTDDIRPGLGFDGLAALKAFVDRGGLLVTEGNSSRLPVDFGFNPSVSIAATPRLLARGAVFRADVVSPRSPILYGYSESTFPVYFNTAPLFTVATGAGVPGGEAMDEASRAVAQNAPDPAIERQAAAQRARVILRFTPKVDSLLISGLLDNGSEMAGKAAVVDAPVGRGHVVMFGIRPMWRYETQGSYAMMLNAMLNWNGLDANVRVGGASRVAGRTADGMVH